MPDGKIANEPAVPKLPGAAKPFTRRRALSIVAAAAGLPLMIAGVRATAPGLQKFEWHGEVLGALSELTLWHSDAGFARATLLKVRLELARFERIFSLYRPESEISRLNVEGSLRKPSRDLVKLIAESQRLGAASGGAFDISVQPLWQLYAAHFWSRTDIQPDVGARARDVARALVDFRRVDSGPSSIGFTQAGMAITLNGVAQGYVTDAIAGLLRNEGFENAVVNLGEFRALGRHPEGRRFRLGIRDAKAADELERMVALENMALAVSGGYGTTFDPSGQFHHIFDPRSGESANALLDVAVIGPEAIVADGLATAICVGGEALAPALLSAYPGTRAVLTRLDGTAASYTTSGLGTA